MHGRGDFSLNDLIQINADERYRLHWKESLSPATFRAYKGQMARFSAWCSENGVSAYPAAPDSISAYIDCMRNDGKSLSTIEQAVAALATVHRAGGVEDPTKNIRVTVALKAAVRALGRAQRAKSALLIDDIALILSYIPEDSFKGLRDRALLSTGFMGGFRRSELSALRVNDLEKTQDKHSRTAYLVHIRHSKTDQAGRGMTKALFHTRSVDAVALLENWIMAAGLAGDDSVFPRMYRGNHIDPRKGLTGDNIAEIVRSRAHAAGIDGDIAAHSLRRGFVTSALAAGATERSVMHQTGHKSTAVLRAYQERQDALDDNAASIF